MNRKNLTVPQKLVAILGVVSLALLGGTSASADEYFSDDGLDSQYYHYTHFQYYNGKTYVTWAGTSDNDPYIRAYDHTTETWSDIVKIATSSLLDDDNHGNPSMVIDHDGYIHVFYGAHGNSANTPIYSRSTNPEDITSWDEMTGVNDYTHNNNGKSTYPHPFVMSNGDLYVLYRNGPHAVPWRIAKSTDNGDNWTTAATVTANTRTEPPLDVDMYLKGSKFAGDDKIAITINDEPQHEARALYYVYLDTADDRLYNVEGDILPTGGLDISDLENGDTLVYDYGGTNTKRCAPDQQVASNGDTYVSNNSCGDGGDHRIFYWNGSSWDHNDNPYRWIMRVSNSAVTVYTKVVGGTGHEKTSTDHGETWTTTDTITTSDTTSSFGGVLQSHHSFHADAQVMFHSGAVGVDDTKLFMWGDSGIIGDAEPAPDTARWKLDETSGTSAPDYTGGGHTGTLNGAATWDAGKIDRAVSLNSGNENTGFIEVPDASSLDFGAGDFTVGFWVLKRTQSSNWTHTWGVNKWNLGSSPGTNEWALNLTSGGSNDIPRFSVESGTTKYTVDATTDIYDEWHHVVGVRDGSTLRIYVDGAQEGTTSIGAAAVNNAGRDLYIGGAEYGNFRPNAMFDDVRIYGRALSAPEVSALYEYKG